MPLKTATYLKSATLRLPRKQKRRELLTVNISLPLGDFRHLSHIGLDTRGDSFGDLATFQRSSSLTLHSSHSHQDLFVTGTPDGTLMPPPKPPRLLTPEEMEAQALNKPRAVAQAPKHKKCHSLPLLDAVEVVEQRMTTETEAGPKHRQQVEQEEGGLRMKVSELDGIPNWTPAPAEQKALAEEDQSFALNLDLGPSILEDVLRVMDKLKG